MTDLQIETILTSAATSALAAFGAVRWLPGRLVDHVLAKKLKEFEADLREKVEEHLGDKAARRQYEFEARKRLYTAFSPLKFQLVQAAYDFVDRIQAIGTDSVQYRLTYKGYFGISTLYRLLRVFGLAELIERQVAAADFAIDQDMLTVIKFKQKAFECLSRKTISLGNPDENWNEQRQHIFYDELTIIGADMIVIDSLSSQPRVMRYNEFDHVIQQKPMTLFRALPSVLENSTPNTKPLLWVRLVALATLCHSFASQEGVEIGLKPTTFPSNEILKACTNSPSPLTPGQEFIDQQRQKHERMLREVSTALASATSTRDEHA